MKRRLFCLIALVCCLAGCSAPAEPSSDATSQSQAQTSLAEQAPASDSSGKTSSAGLLFSAEDVALVPTDDYAYGYVFNYGDQEFTALFDTYSWRVYDSWRISNHDDLVFICQALLNEHLVYGSDWTTPRTADDMAYEWEQHNLAYALLPESSPWRDDVRNVDLDPDDQGKSFQEMYESRTGKKLDLGDIVSLGD